MKKLYGDDIEARTIVGCYSLEVSRADYANLRGNPVGKRTKSNENS